MSRLPFLATLAAVLAALGALAFLLMSSPPGAEPVTELGGDVPPPTAPSRALASRPVPGGVYAGVVTDAEGKPLHGARVLLVAYQAGGLDLRGAQRGDEARELPVVGGYEPGGEAVTDRDGRFRIAADAQSHITRVLAYHTGYFLDVVEVSRPRTDLVLALQRGGRVIGTVVDDVTGEAVRGALVDIYLQQRVSPVPDVPEGSRYPVIQRAPQEVSWLATLGRFIPQVLGPRIYGLADEGTETLRLRTDANGRFELGPLGSAVQVEFVVTHPAYKWIDFDTDEGKKTPRRTVVQAGETVEREFRLRKGGFVAGQVVDDAGKGVPEVLVKVQSISAYYRHWWYKHKHRTARTDEEGRFRVEGLAIGSQQLSFMHPSFGTVDETAEPGAEDLVVVAPRLGGLHGVVTGIVSRPTGRKAVVHLESTEEDPRVSRRQERPTVLDANNEFVLSRLVPGRYRVWVRAGKETSQPIPVEIVPVEVTRIDLEMGGGGTVIVRFVDGSGVVIDPVSARLIQVGDDGERPLGLFVSREGELDVDGVAPGTYRLRADAQGRIPATTAPFEVRAGRVTRLPALVLDDWGYLAFGQPVYENGRPAEVGEDFVLEVRVGDGAFERVLRVGVPRPVRPGPVTVRARTGDLRYEGRHEVLGGRTTQVVVVLAPAR